MMSKVIAFPVRPQSAAAFPTFGALALAPREIEDVPREIPCLPTGTAREESPHQVEVIPFPGAWDESEETKAAPRRSPVCIFKTRIGGSRKFSEIFSATYDSALPSLAAISQEVATESGRKITSDPMHFYQHALAKDFAGERRPKSIAMVEGASDLGSGNHRLFIGDQSGLTVVDEAQGTINFDYETSAFFPDRGVLPYDRVNHARYRAYSIRSITNGLVPSDRVDGIVPISKDLVAVIQYGNAPGTTPSIVLLDLSVWGQERQEYFTAGPGWIKGQLDEPLVIHTDTVGGIQTAFYAADALGSITEVIGKDGALLGEAVYRSFGSYASVSGFMRGGPYGYTAREFDNESHLGFFRSRYYDPQTGRFLNEDPLLTYLQRNDLQMIDFLRQIGAPDIAEFLIRPLNLNLYAATLNNPLNNIDPQGLKAPSLNDPWDRVGLLFMAGGAFAYAMALVAVAKGVELIFRLDFAGAGLHFVSAGRIASVAGALFLTGAAIINRMEIYKTIAKYIGFD